MDPCLPSDLTSCASVPHSLHLNILTSLPVLRWPDSSLFSHCSPCLEILSLEICMAPSSLTFKSWLKCNLSSEIHSLFTLCFTWQPALAHTAWNSWFLWLWLLFFFLSQILALVNMDITLFEINTVSFVCLSHWNPKLKREGSFVFIHWYILSGASQVSSVVKKPLMQET